VATPSTGGISVSLPGVTVAGVAVYGSTAYVSGKPASGTGPGNVYVVDLGTSTVTATIPVGNDPGPIVATDGGTAYVANRGDDTISFIVPGMTSEDQTLALPAGQSPTSIQYYPYNTPMLYVGATGQGNGYLDTYGTVWPAGPNPVVSPVGTQTWAGSDNVLLTMPATYVYAALGGASVHELYAVTGPPFATGSTTDLPANPLSLAGGFVTESNGTVDAYNSYNNTLTGASVHIPLAAVVSSCTDFPFNSNTFSLYVTAATAGKSYLYQINSADTEVTGEIPVPGPGYVADDGNGTLVYAANSASGATLVTLPVATAVIPVTAPVITSTAKTATFTTGKAGKVTFTATGSPTVTFATTGKLPAGVTLTPAGVLSGTPKPGTGGVYRITIVASNGISAPATEKFTVTVDQPAAFTSASHVTFKDGKGSVFTVKTSGYPVAVIKAAGVLPPGVKLTIGMHGTATFSGIPAKSARGKKYLIHLSARNGAGKVATQLFILAVS
jgi:Putative Ig domain